MSNIFKKVGTKCPGAKYPGAKCPGAKCPWGILSLGILSLGQNVLGAKCPLANVCIFSMYTQLKRNWEHFHDFFRFFSKLTTKQRHVAETSRQTAKSNVLQITIKKCWWYKANAMVGYVEDTLQKILRLFERKKKQSSSLQLHLVIQSCPSFTDRGCICQRTDRPAWVPLHHRS